MSDIKVLNKKDLEKKFAENFASPTFPILGELYLKDKDFNRAEKVCRIGLQHDPKNINGYYILSKIYLYNNQLEDAEKTLEIIIQKNPLHINALRLIIELHKQLKKPKKNRLKYIQQLFNIFPDDKELEKQLINIDNSYQKNKKIVQKDKPKDNINIQKNLDFNVRANMATLTFVEILKNQKHYSEALKVLSIIESQSKKNKKIQKIQDEIQKLLIESN